MSKAAKSKAEPSAFNKPMTPSAELSAVIGKAPLSRPQATKKIWNYIKQHNLQDPKNKRSINADDKLKPLFGKAQVTMFELPGVLSAHLKG